MGKSIADHFPKPVEYAILGLIVLVIAFMFVEELALILGWGPTAMAVLIVLALLFDLFFSIEFTLRAIISLARGQFGEYMTRQRGWADLAASYPLLLFVSGPAVLLLLLGSSQNPLIGLVSVLHAVRVFRALRLLRIVKLFGRVGGDSDLTARHLGSVATIGVTSVVVVLAFAQFVPVLNAGDRGAYRETKVEALTQLFDAVRPRGQGAPDLLWIGEFLKGNPEYRDLIAVQNPEGKIVYRSPEQEALRLSAYENGAWIPLGESGYWIQLSYRSADAEHARLTLFALFVILAMFAALMLLYGRRFAQEVADPIYIMNRGLRQWEYNLEVSFPRPRPARDEIYYLAQAFNERWLPLKEQIRDYRRRKNGG